ncbi:MAG: RNase P subunit p30 family protein [Candidatus Thorarchaeota archaeon]
MVIDVGVCIPEQDSLQSFIQIAEKLGFTGLATNNIEGDVSRQIGYKFSILRRADVSGRGLRSLRKKVETARKQSLVVSVKLGSVETANWAADDQRVDLLTLDYSREHRLRDTTARLAAASHTALEIRFEPLLRLTGLNRSIVIKAYRASIRTAIEAGMQIILSSGATHPLHMRSVRAMQYIGGMLGLDSKQAHLAINQTPMEIIKRNRQRYSSEYVADGVEIIQRGVKE